MERYSSHLAVDETVEDIDDAYKAEMLKYYRDKENISDDITFDECYGKFGQRWDGGVCRKDEDGVWRKHIMYNKNAKWDWYMEGGRWSGFIQHFKDNITEILDKDDYTIGKDGKLKIRKDINSVPKKYIDFDAIREKAKRDAIREYTEVEEGVGKELIQRTIAEGEKVGIIGEDDFIEIPCDEKFDGKEYNHKVNEFVKKYLENTGKALPDDIVWFPGRRNDKRNKVRFLQPTFSMKEDGAKSILSKIENVNKPCYTTLYDIDENCIKVRYGKIVKGDYVDTYDENKKIIRTLTT